MKYNQKCEAVPLNQKLSESSTLDTSVGFDSTSIGNCPYDIELSYEDFVANEVQVEATEKGSVPETPAQARLLSTERLMDIVGINGLLDDQRSYDSDVSAFPKQDNEDTRLLHVSTELACEELEVEAAKKTARDSWRLQLQCIQIDMLKKKSLQSPGLLPSA